MKKKNRKRIEEQLAEMETRLANAEEYVAKNVNVEGKSFLHFDDWKGKSGHPAVDEESYDTHIEKSSDTQRKAHANDRYQN